VGGPRPADAAVAAGAATVEVAVAPLTVRLAALVEGAVVVEAGAAHRRLVLHQPLTAVRRRVRAEAGGTAVLLTPAESAVARRLARASDRAGRRTDARRVAQAVVAADEARAAVVRAVAGRVVLRARVAVARRAALGAALARVRAARERLAAVGADDLAEAKSGAGK